MGPPRARRALLALAVAAGLLDPGSARAQGFPVPIPPSVVLGPLLLLLIPLGMQLSRSDDDRVRQLEARQDWSGIVSLATQRLARQPRDPNWLELRGRALQRLGRCGEAIPDLALAFDAKAAQPEPARAYAAGLALGLCQMGVHELAAAAATFQRLAALAPSQWEPDYNLGVIRMLQGDEPGAQASLAALRGKHPPAAHALESAIEAARGAPRVASDVPRVASDVPPGQPRLPAPRLAVGDRAVNLPAADWFDAGTAASRVTGGALQVPSARSEAVALTTAYAWAMEASGGLGAAVAFTANPRQAYGISRWNAPEGCKPEGALHAEGNASFDRPECLWVRKLQGASAWQAAPWPGAAAMPAAPSLAYEVHYERWGNDRMVAVTFLLPTQRLAGDMAAVQWARALAAALRPLGTEPGAREATLPAMLP